MWVFLGSLLWGAVFFMGAGSVWASTGDIQEEMTFPLMVGFQGKHPQDPQVNVLKDALSQGLISGVIFFRPNLENPEQVRALTQAFREVDCPLTPLLAIDQEGGLVQRLGARNGFQDFPSAQDVGAMDPCKIRPLYDAFAAQVRDGGFNYVLGPVVDLSHPESAAIGRLKRGYGQDPAHVSACAQIFVEAHRAQGIATSLKHFPGHGFARGDTHKGLVDVSATFEERELTPFQALIEKDLADSVMVAHVHNDLWDKEFPASLSPPVIRGILREKWGYAGVVVTDDLHMGAIVDTWQDPHAVAAQAVRAGNDLLLFSNNKMAAQGTGTLQETDLKSLQEGLRAQLGEDFHAYAGQARLRVDRLRKTLGQPQ